MRRITLYIVLLLISWQMLVYYYQRLFVAEEISSASILLVRTLFVLGLGVSFFVGHLAYRTLHTAKQVSPEKSILTMAIIFAITLQAAGYMLMTGLFG
jgi:hypothetical protein